ncbi:ice-binding family protein [Cellulosimicrobium sp. Marseille-Q4280]|uniref:ice-binding family protein n=1 Tax=Cellulosimicrobium sp. Marseille-Q4280 TaxID=2937992 RepID=UPI0020424E6E|nr:ice-binding family protein [Cellulosimicrobium sp. Marseille-Q4280]
MHRSLRSAVPAAFSRDGWAALCLGVLAEVFLVLTLALTTVSLVPLAFGWHGSVVQTGSMRPHIDPGDLVLLTDLPTDSPVPVGGVVQFRTPAAAEPSGESGSRLHRIVASGEEEGRWVTAGDANPTVDSNQITRNQITGQARLLVPWVGLPSLWIAHGRLGLVALWGIVTLAAFLVVAWWWPERVPRPGARPNTTSSPSTPGGPSRRSALAALVVLGLGAVVTARGEPVTAAFTARTVSTGNTFRVATAAPLRLGRAATYTVLAATRVANQAFLGIGSSITGDVAVSPGSTVSGFWPWDVSGTIERNTVAARNARDDALALAAAIDARATTVNLPATVTGTFYPGVGRRSGAVQITQTLTLDARGDTSAVFVLSATAITLAASARVVLRNGASADRVFFRGTSGITISDTATARGTFLADGDISLGRDAALTGRAQSLHGAVVLTRATVAHP